MSNQDNQGVTEETLYEAVFDPKVVVHGRVTLVLWSLVTILGILFVPFVLLFSLWYHPEYLRRISARLTTNAVEIRKGVFFRKESPFLSTESPMFACTTALSCATTAYAGSGWRLLVSRARTPAARGI